MNGHEGGQSVGNVANGKEKLLLNDVNVSAVENELIQCDGNISSGEDILIKGDGVEVSRVNVSGVEEELLQSGGIEKSILSDANVSGDEDALIKCDENNVCVSVNIAKNKSAVSVEEETASVSRDENLHGLFSADDIVCHLTSECQCVHEQCMDEDKDLFDNVDNSSMNNENSHNANINGKDIILEIENLVLEDDECGLQDEQEKLACQENFNKKVKEVKVEVAAGIKKKKNSEPDVFNQE